MVEHTEDVDQTEVEPIVQLQLIQDGTWGDGPDATDTAEKIMGRE